MQRSLSTIAASITDTLTAAAVSSQLDAQAVNTFAAGTVEALHTIAAALDAIDAEAAAAVKEQSGALLAELAALALDAEAQGRALASMRAELAEAGAALAGLRSEIASLAAPK